MSGHYVPGDSGLSQRHGKRLREGSSQTVEYLDSVPMTTPLPEVIENLLEHLNIDVRLMLAALKLFHQPQTTHLVGMGATDSIDEDARVNQSQGTSRSPL